MSNVSDSKRVTVEMGSRGSSGAGEETAVRLRAALRAMARGAPMEEILDATGEGARYETGAARLAARMRGLANVFHEAQFTILYGSAVMRGLRPDSDLDVAVMYPHALDTERLIRLVAEAASAVHRDVDLLDLRQAGPIIKMQVLRHGEPFLINDAHAFELFRMYVPTEYFDFKRSRRRIEEAIIGRAKR